MGFEMDPKGRVDEAVGPTGGAVGPLVFLLGE